MDKRLDKIAELCREINNNKLGCKVAGCFNCDLPRNILTALEPSNECSMTKDKCDYSSLPTPEKEPRKECEHEWLSLGKQCQKCCEVELEVVLPKINLDKMGDINEPTNSGDPYPYKRNVATSKIVGKVTPETPKRIEPLPSFTKGTDYAEYIFYMRDKINELCKDRNDRVGG